MMYHKALEFHDDYTANLILQTPSPRQAKALGRTVRNFNNAKWRQVARKIVYEGNVYKFLQSKEFRETLLSTRGYILVEASPYD